MRGAIGDVEPAVRIIDLVPAIYQEDTFTRSFLAGFDDVIAPVFSTLDNLDGYVDPSITPDDFLPWLAGWVGVTLAEDWSAARQRALVASAVHLYRVRGTVAGLRAELHLYTGGTVEITETGGASYSQRADGAEPPGEAVPRLAIRVEVDDPSRLRASTLDGIVRAAKPAHIAHSIEIIERKAE